MVRPKTLPIEIRKGFIMIYFLVGLQIRRSFVVCNKSYNTLIANIIWDDLCESYYVDVVQEVEEEDLLEITRLFKQFKKGK